MNWFTSVVLSPNEVDGALGRPPAVYLHTRAHNIHAVALKFHMHTRIGTLGADRASTGDGLSLGGTRSQSQALPLHSRSCFVGVPAWRCQIVHIFKKLEL